MTVTQIIRRSDLSPNDLKLLLSATPSPQALEQLKVHLDLISSKLLERSNLCEGTKYVSLTGGVLTLLAAVSTGGVGAGVCAVVSGIGALSAWWHSGEIAQQSDRLLEFTIKLSNLIEGANSSRLAQLWQLAGTDEFWHFLSGTVAASDEYANGLKIKVRVDGRVRLLEPSQGMCYRFAETYGMTPDALLGKLDRLDQTLPVPTSPTVEIPAVVKPEPVPPTARASTVDTEALAPKPIPSSPNVPTPIVDTPSTNAPVPTNSRFKPPSVFSVAQSFAATLRSMFILGCPGVGKGLIVSLAWREVKQLFPNLIVYVIDPKNSDRESGYWEGVDYRDGLPVNSLLIPRAEKAAWLRDRLVEFDSLPSPKLLIVDELVALSKNLGNYPDSKEAYTMLTDYAVSIVSSGQSEGQFVWLITQSPNLNTLKIDGGDATIFPGVLLYRDGIDNEAWLKSTARCTLGSAVTIDSDEIFRVASDSPRRAIAFDTRQKKWQPIPNLENHSGFNRDEYLKTLESEAEGTNWDDELAILNQRTKTIAVEVPKVAVDPIADWDNGYIANDESLIEVLDAIERKYGKEPFSPSEFHRNLSPSQRELYGGTVPNLKALLYLAVSEGLAISEVSDRGGMLIRLT